MDEQTEASASCATVFEALREPGFRQLCAASLLDASVSGFVFLEVPLAALKTVAKLLPRTADRPAEQRFKPLLARARAVSYARAPINGAGAERPRLFSVRVPDRSAGAARLDGRPPQTRNTLSRWPNTEEGGKRGCLADRARGVRVASRTACACAAMTR